MTTPTGNPCGTINGIEFEEPEGSGQLDFSKDGARGMRSFHIDWADRKNFVTALKGGSITSSAGTILVQAKGFPGYENLLCQELSVRGLGEMTVDGEDPAYPFARVDAIYLPQDSGGGGGGSNEDEILRTEEIDASFVTLDAPPMQYYFFETPSGLDAPEGLRGFKRFVQLRHTLTEEKSPTNKQAIIQAHVGRVNADVFLGVPAGRLLYTGARVRRVILASGEQPFKLVHTFLERPENGQMPDAHGNNRPATGTWQQYYDFQDGMWSTIYNRATTKQIFPYGTSTFTGSGLLG